MRNPMMVVMAIVAAAGCAHVPQTVDAGQFKTPAGCSGVPGDFRTPLAARHADPPTHGPGAPGMIEQVEMRETSGFKRMPSLYVFDPAGMRVYSLSGHDPGEGDVPLDWLSDPAFVRAEADGYWGEIVDHGFELVPEFDTCQLTAALDTPLGTSAPERGLMFLQYVSRGCRNCSGLSRAIQRVIDAHPDRRFRWMQVRTRLPVGRR